MSLSLNIPLVPCRILKNDPVPCHYRLEPHVAVANVHHALSNLRNSHVALLILGVKGHSISITTNPTNAVSLSSGL